MSKYPELADPAEWTPRMLYIHRRAFLLGKIFGAVIVGMLWLLREIVW